MSDVAVMFTLFYIVFSFCFVFRTNEFVSAGVTIENLFSSIGLIGREVDNFVFYHIKRTSYTFLIHSSLLLGYRLMFSLVINYPLLEEGLTLLNAIGTLGLVSSITSAVIVYWWSRDNWENHPASRRLSFLPDTSWRTIASIVNGEYLRSLKKIIIKSNSLDEVLITDNWIIKTTPYSIYFAYQSVAMLSIENAETYALAVAGTGSVQYVKIKVSFASSSTNISDRSCHFYFRINALDFKELEENLNIPIDMANWFYRSKTDQFLEVFKQHVCENPPYQFTEKVDLCHACIVNPSDVKLVKNCTDEGPNPCGSCYCRRPMWCLSCMGRWFAARLELEEVPTEQWLSSKCMCPGCRSVFCIHDISLVNI